MKRGLRIALFVTLCLMASLVLTRRVRLQPPRRQSGAMPTPGVPVEPVRQWGRCADPCAVPDIDLRLVPVRAGRYVMGTTHSEVWSEIRAVRHQVEITRPFWISRCEVTQRQYRDVMQTNPSRHIGDDRPVEQVSWHDAVSFCNRLTEAERRAGRLPDGHVFRLPTEAEWEYCCRAGNAYDDNRDLTTTAWTGANSAGAPHPVSTRKANAWGLHDMLGNVAEWCGDWLGEYPYGRVRDPVGPPTGTRRVIRGGSWIDDSVYCRAGHRDGGDPDGAGPLVGFRVVLGPE